MSQNDFTIANQTFPNTRADINSALQALASTSSGSSAPSTTFANQFFYNTTSNLLQIRNEGNDAFITIANLDQTADNVEFFKATAIRLTKVEFEDGDDALSIADGGAVTVSTSLDMNGTELILDADADTSITADTDDRIDIKVGNADVAHITKNVIGGIINRRNVQPLIINGDMALAQRGTSFTSQTGVAYHLDRYEVNGFNMGDGVYRVDQSTNVPAGQGLPYSNKISCTTADTSQDANNQFYFQTQLEGFNTSLLNYFASSPDTVSIAFWVQSNRTGTHSLALKLSDNGSAENSGDTRIYHKLYTINQANTWERKVCAITLDPSTGQTKVINNRFAVAVQFWLGAGTNRDGAAAESWIDNGNATTASANEDMLASTANNWYITGLQMEVGEYDLTTIPPFQHETIIDNQNRCSRYFQKFASSNNQGVGEGFSSDGTGRGATMIPFLPMRASPTVTTSAASTFKFQQGVTTSGNGTGFIIAGVNNNQGANQGQAYGVGLFRVHLDVSVSGMAQDGRFCRGQSNGDSFVQVNAEL